jgi:hypothetical protein
MAEFTYTIPDEQLQEIGEAFCQQYGYQTEIDGEPNPQNPLQFTLGCVDRYIKDIIKAHRVWKEDEKIRKAKAAAIAAVDDFQITVKE